MSKWTTLALVFLLLAGAEFIWRGPVRAIRTATGFNDFLSPYIQADAWARGLDPYSPQVLLQLWPAQASQYAFLTGEVANGTLVAKRGIPTAYPITSLVLISPFDLLPWNFAYALWLILNCAMFAGMVAALVALCGFSYGERQGIFFLAGILALAPFHTGIATANVTLIAVELSVIAVWATRQQYDVMAAVLLTLATGLKPQIGLCFVLYYLMRRRWKMCGIVFAMLGGITLVGLSRLQISHAVWVADYINDNRALFESGLLGNFTAINPTRFGLMNLQVALCPMLRGFHLTNDVAAGVGAALLVVWLVAMLRQRNMERPGLEYELLDLSAIGVISLLPVYHRFYDAGILVLPLAWAMISIGRARVAAGLALLLMAPFLVPGGTLLQTMQERGWIPPTLGSEWWWQSFVMAHEVWLLLLLGGLLLWRMNLGCKRRFTTEREAPSKKRSTLRFV